MKSTIHQTLTSQSISDKIDNILYKKDFHASSQLFSRQK